MTVRERGNPTRNLASLFFMLSLFVLISVVRGQSTPKDAQSPTTAPKSLDFEFFKARVEPIFLKNRGAEHARCYACHERTKHPRGFHLEMLLPGATFWTEEQSRLNFEAVSLLVNTRDPLKSIFLRHPLAPEAGGDAVYVHSGGRQFQSQDDPDWQNMKAWALGTAAEVPAKSTSQSASRQ